MVWLPVIRLASVTVVASFTARVDGRRLFTPMVIVISAIGLANVIFALDSVPAIFGLTKDPYTVFTASAFALMGLRHLSFLIGGLLERIIYLNIGLSVILAFIGVKLIIEALHGSNVDAIGPYASARNWYRGFCRLHHRHTCRHHGQQSWQEQLPTADSFRPIRSGRPNWCPPTTSRRTRSAPEHSSQRSPHKDRHPLSVTTARVQTGP
jgi:hypothetical protein